MKKRSISLGEKQEESFMRKPNKNYGGYAFPMPATTWPDGMIEPPEFGMYLRDWFAGLALSAISTSYAADYTAQKAYAIADAMLVERSISRDGAL